VKPGPLPDQRSFAVRVTRPDDGRLLWLHYRGKTECDESGEPVRITGTSTDMTDRKKAEADLRDAHQRLEIVVEADGLRNWFAFDALPRQSDQRYADT